MNRRRILVLSALAAVVVRPSRVCGQQADRVHRVGLLAVGVPRGPEQRTRSAFVQSLKSLGWVEGANLVLEERGSMTVDELDHLAAELVALKVDVIYAGGTPACRAAKRATASIPIVMVVGVDPVAEGLVAALSRPGGNVTGVTALSSDLIDKRIGLLTEIIPHGARIAYMWNPTNPGNASAWEQTRKLASVRGISVRPMPVAQVGELDEAFARMTRERVGGLLVGADDFLRTHRARLAELALKHRIPAMYSFREHVEAGGLMAYAADWDALRRRAASYVDRIFRGARPGHLPIEQATTFDFAINARTARALNLTIPPALLGRADTVIE